MIDFANLSVEENLAEPEPLQKRKLQVVGAVRLSVWHLRVCDDSRKRERRPADNCHLLRDRPANRTVGGHRRGSAHQRFAAPDGQWIVQLGQQRVDIQRRGG